MGVYHFMGLGKAIGAVTCAVDYIEKALDAIEQNKANDAILRLFGSSGGINHEEASHGKIEAIVLFTSKEIISSDPGFRAFAYTGCNEPGSVRKELLKNLKNVWQRIDPDIGPKVFWCEVDIDDFWDCFDKIIKVSYRFSPQGKQGKEIWCNLTGGANVIGQALLTMARLTGLSTKHYMITQRSEHQKEVRVPRGIQLAPNKDGYFNVLPFIRTNIDTVSFYSILDEMERAENDGKTPIKTGELHSRLKGRGLFLHQDRDQFVRQSMLKLYGLGYTDYNADLDTCQLSELGHQFLSNQFAEWENAIHFEDLTRLGTEEIVEQSKTWDWFSSSTL